MTETSNYTEQELNTVYEKIRSLKKEKDVVLLAHYYMPPELQLLENEGGIADFLGDSLGLSLEARSTKAKHILFCGVRFMAETAFIINPSKKIFMPDTEAGCSLASSITAEDVRQLRIKHPGIPVIGYINTYAETKTELDICCTSRNAINIAASFKEDTLIFVPDIYMGQNLQTRIERELGKKLILWNGVCEVHEQFRGEALATMVNENANAEVLMHWEVPESAVNSSFKNHQGVLGSTNDIIKHVENSKSKQFILASECDLGSTLKRMFKDKEFVTPCIKCQYMKLNQLNKVLAALEAIGTPGEEKYLVKLPVNVLNKAYRPVERMLEFK